MTESDDRNHFKPLWLLTAIVVVVLIGGATFLAVERVTGHTESIDANCKQRNEQLLAVNEKFKELNALIEVLTRATPGGALTQPEAREAFETLRQPIPTVTCK
jgi:hypothetical protein